ncbi:alpha/beta hydrolase family protein [Gemmatimonas sp.]|uniref:alpha/beta hydrolase family protein n=1 Tax=Gemmatimonas sp. TaxID=1962908 RepID=UPI0039834568
MGRSLHRAVAHAGVGATARLIGLLLGVSRWAAVVVLSAAALACDGCTAPSSTARGGLSDHREVRVEVDSGVTLAGDFAWPLASATTPVPAILLLSGSGAQDRDGTRIELPGYRPFADVADTLLAAGFAVLRLDDRGVGASTGRFDGTTTEDFARDAAAAVAWLRAQSRVQPERIALVGHSEGALVALLVARADPQLWALGLLGAAARSGREIARWQRATLVATDLTTWAPAQRAAVLARAESDADAIAATDPWLRTWFSLDPRTIARDVRQPALLLHGENDRQVAVEQVHELAAVLHNARAMRLSHTNHLLLDDFDGDPRGYVRLTSRRIDGGILRVLVTFLQQQNGENRFSEGKTAKQIR